jgi:mRNA interferase RelE/StbE
MLVYEDSILKDVEKGRIPHQVFLQIHHCFESILKVGDMTIFDVKQLKGSRRPSYYRLRKGRYRAVFYFENGRITVVALEHRSEVYRKWH